MKVTWKTIKKRVQIGNKEVGHIGGPTMEFQVSYLDDRRMIIV